MHHLFLSHWPKVQSWRLQTPPEWTWVLVSPAKKRGHVRDTVTARHWPGTPRDCSFIPNLLSGTSRKYCFVVRLSLKRNFRVIGRPDSKLVRCKMETQNLLNFKIFGFQINYNFNVISFFNDKWNKSRLILVMTNFFLL